MKESDQNPAVSDLRCAVFDLDGVLTDTAAVHASAWKAIFDDVLATHAEATGTELVPFDKEEDYRTYVDGRPRYDGVENFLSSRGIVRERGEPSDAPELDTYCGIGNRKNAVFLDRLEAEGVRVFPDAIVALDRLAANGVRIGLHTSSRNGRPVLTAGGIIDRFEAIVDGNDLLTLGIPGKPDPAPFREVAYMLGVEPNDAAVIEDATAGVRSGRRGGFGVVVGVARGEADPEDLLAHGADTVVEELTELDPDPRTWRRAGAAPPRPLDQVPEATADAVMERLGGRTPVVFCDFDGVLSEIVNDPDAATITPAGRDALRQLARACPVAVVSGRGAPDVAGRLGLDGLYVAGSHGFELIAPDGSHTVQDRAAAKASELAAAADALQAEVGGIDGVLVENKRFSIAVHYRNADPSTHERVQAAVVAEGERRGLISSGGKMIRELRPPLPWDKGAAVIDLLGRIAPDPDAPAIYLGDDLTDEDAFRVLRGWGVSIAVRGGDHATVADLAVDDPDGIAALLAELGRRLT